MGVRLGKISVLGGKERRGEVMKGNTQVWDAVKNKGDSRVTCRQSNDGILNS